MHTSLTDVTSVLIVDDTQFARRMVRSAVSKVLPDATVAEADSGEAAIALIDGGERFRFALLDLTMPGMNGIELAAAIRDRLPDIRIALVTANIQDSVRLRCETSDIVFIEKPASPAKLKGFLVEGVAP